MRASARAFGDVTAPEGAWPYVPAGSTEDAVRTHGESAIAWIAHDDALR